MPKNTELFSPLYFHTGDVIDGTGGDVFSELFGLAALIATEDRPDYHCIQVTRVVFDHHGRAHTSDASNEAADLIAALYDNKNIPTPHDSFVSPLVSQWTDWTPETEDPYSFDPREEHGLTAAMVL